MKQNAAKRDQWRAWIEEWEASGKSAEQFGRERGVHASTVYWWRKELRQQNLPAVRGAQTSTVTFLQMPLKAAALTASGAEAIEVVLRGERRVRVPENFSVQTLQAVVRALEAVG